MTIIISSAILAAFIGGFILFRVQRFNSFRAASASFRKVFLTELGGLYPIPSDWPADKMTIDRTLRDKFPRLQAAVAEFREFLPWYRRKAFDRAWFIYRMGEDGREIDKQDYWQYIPHSGASLVNDEQVRHDNTKTFQENFKRNVDNLLKFAKNT